MAYNALSAFYTSREWAEFRKVLISQRTKPDGLVYDEITGKAIVRPYDIILHHKIPLTLDNVHDASIALNPENIQIVSFKTHNEIHERYGSWTRHIYLVYGCPLAGKKTYVAERAGVHDLVIDIDKIYACISNNPFYVKSGRLWDCKEAVKSALLDCVKNKRGKWINAFIIGGIEYAYTGARERFCREYNAEPVYIECSKELALARLESAQDGRDVTEWTGYINKYFEMLQM